MEISLQNNDLQMLYKDVPAAVACFDESGNVIACSDAFGEILGRSIYDVLRLNYQRLFPLLKHQISDVFYELVSRYEEQVIFPQLSNECGIAGSQIYDFVFSYKEISGKKIITLVLDEIVETKSIIDPHTVANNLPNLMDHINTLVVLVSVDGVVIDANKASLDVIGSGIESVKDRYFWECPWWKKDAHLQQKIKFVCRKVSKGEKARFDVSIFGVKNDVIIDFTMKPVANSNGKITHLIASASDITSRRKFEDATRLSQQRFESVINRTTDGLVIFDTQGQIRFANKGFLNLVDRQLDLTLQNIHHFFKTSSKDILF